MDHELPKAYDPALIEEKWAKFWADEHLFDVPTPASTDLSSGPEAEQRTNAAARSAASTGKPFAQLLPPPNVTGRLHMGHMLNQTEMDILTRWHRMCGDTALWVPGTDHAGIATQMMVERQLAAEGKSRADFTREEFTARVWAWKQQYGSAITEQMKRLGASVDWSREYFTMDDRLSVAVKHAFVRLWNQGLIYRGAYIVNWDPQLQSAVSDLEVENEERAGHLYHIRYDLADGTGSITIATTRPETMLGDTAVAVNPSDPRYQHLIGRSLTLPLSAAGGQPDRQIPILADDWANPEFGTGAVKVTPAHDPNDFAIGQRHNLPSPSIMDTRGRIDLPGSPYDKLDRFEARKCIVADLEAAGHLVAIKDHTLTLPISQRTGAVIEPRLSMQWFLAVNKTPNPTTAAGAPSSPAASSSAKVGSATEPTAVPNSIAASFDSRPSIAQLAIDALQAGHIKFTPEMYTKTYNEWMSNLHDWCLSRQLWWGHRIPAWHCGACGEINVALEAPTACAKCGSAQLTQETDVLDTWFSSGLLPFTVFGWPGEEGSGNTEQGLDKASSLTPDLAAFYPTSLLVTGFDILFFWVARMIMLGCHFMLDVPMPDGSPRALADAVPFRQVYIHALVRDADRQKMSKTKGNVIDPIAIVTKYGTDAVRFTLASQASPGTDIAFNEARTEGYRAFANKIWNAARFLQMNLDRGREAGYKVSLSGHNSALLELPEHTPLETRWIFSRLSNVSDSIAHSLAAYRFDEAASAVYQFFWGEFCDWYLELVKLRLNFDEPHNDITALTLNALITVFEAALRLLSPFMPFLTEELWHALCASVGTVPPAKSIALTRYPQSEGFPRDQHTETIMNVLQHIIMGIRSLRKEFGVPEKETVPAFILEMSYQISIDALVVSEQAQIERLTRTNVSNSSGHVPGLAYDDPRWRPYGPVTIAVLYNRPIDVPAERERLTRDLAKYSKGLEAANKQLSNDGFLARAPEAIVAGLRKQHAETLALKEKAEAALAALPTE